MTRVHTVVIFAFVALGSVAAQAADSAAPLPVKGKALQPKHRWTGLYFGGHFGYGGGGFGSGTNPAHNESVIFPSSATGLIGGYQVGYNQQLPNNVVLGVEGDMTFLSPINVNATAAAPFNTTLNYFSTVRVRAGYAFDNFVPYITGGLAVGQSKIEALDGTAFATRQHMHVGWTAGAGVEVALDRHWSAKLEYNYIDLGTQTFSLDTGVLSSIAVDPKLHVVKLGLNYKLDNTASRSEQTFPAMTVPDAPESKNWNVHGQTTFIVQGYPGFRSPYQGANSLPGGGQTRETWTNTAFLGWRLWDGGEFYFNPELAQGFGLNSTLGLAGFSNGEAQKGGAPYPRLRAQRYFFRQTFGLGGEQENVEDGPNQLAGKRDIDRVTLTVGRIAIGDIFDANSYAHDPRADFQNWAMWSSVAYDFPADLPGFTRGVVVELNRKMWALRGGWFQVPEAPNSDALTFKTGGGLLEYEQRWEVLNQPGRLRVGAFWNRGNTGSYQQAVTAVTIDPALDINAAILGTREQRNKYGFYVNGEQAITKDLGVFGRFSWNDGQNEILSFTDVDRSISGGVSLKGTAWKRPDDTIGFGGAINGLSEAHRNFLAAGGLGLLIGDGALNYREEKILETYYAYKIDKTSTLTADYQFIDNPAYNADRGPAHVFTGRFHAEF
jgi:high affinity Mn2+ porin